MKYLGCSGNLFTSVDFLNTLPNPEKLTKLNIKDNNIQPTDIEIFRKFTNLETLNIGTSEIALKVGKLNKFYGSLKSYQNLTKLEAICIESTDVDEGLEYLPRSLVELTSGRIEPLPYSFRCLPHIPEAKVKAIRDQLRPFNYDLEA